jgi:NAD(P)-dependent dehydrogenase (short-subunit alcohol dehydrogenase family)
MRFKDKVVLVTGGNSGIGFATAKRLVSEGATVIITGRDKKRVDQSVQELGAKSLGIVADVTKTEDIDRVYSEIKSKFGKLDGLFANAGVATFEPITQITEKSYDNLMNTNVKGVFFTLQKAIPLLSKGASIVINSSVLNTKGSPGASVYGSTKAAVRSLARSFSSELVGSGVRVNVVSPGPIATPIWESDGVPAAVRDERAANIAKTNPSKRFGQPEEIAGPVAFLLSDDSSYVVGAELYVDGGASQL